MTTPPAYTYDRNPGTRANPHHYGSPSRSAQSLVLLLVGYGDDCCYVTMLWDEYLATEDVTIWGACIDAGWLRSDLNEFLEGTVEEIGRMYP